MSIAEEIKELEEDLQLASAQGKKDEMKKINKAIATLKEKQEALPKIKVTLRLNAIAYYHFDKEVEVPADTTNDELDEMVDDLYDKTDGGEFEADDSWDRGSCTWEKEE